MSDPGRTKPSEPFLRSARLTFNESHIVLENVTRFQEKAKFLSYLTILIKRTKDPSLRMDLLSLREKITPMTIDQYQQLRQDADQTRIIFPPNYLLPSGG